MFEATQGRNEFTNEAFKLAEDYHDFRSLASLCHKGKVYPPQENPNAERIEAYIDKYSSLVPFLADSATGTPASDPPPPEQVSKAISLQVGLFSSVNADLWR